MLYIIDGYNIINSNFNFLFQAPTLEGKRTKLFEFIIERRPHGSLNNQITVVFDCKSKNPYETDTYNRTHFKEIEVIFSDGVLLADDIIVELCDEAAHPAQITVVTNDKGIHRRISLSGAKHESVEKFISKANKSKNIKKAQERLSSEVREKINKEFEKIWIK
ncbi:MAG: NYN domain-containing protein [Elusimicrobiota bacterium]|jgi:predicted RNA-binding protein with PIN domain|nr:NYN domain-containing protein [Elusimicrobiota bacterium]